MYQALFFFPLEPKKQKKKRKKKKKTPDRRLLACRLFSLFLCLSQALYSKFVDVTTQIQKHFPLSVFVLIDSLVVFALQDAGGYAISLQYNLELHLGCHTC